MEYIEWKARVLTIGRKISVGCTYSVQVHVGSSPGPRRVGSSPIPVSDDPLLSY